VNCLRTPAGSNCASIGSFGKQQELEMASTPDTHPDSNPTGPSESPEQVSPIDEPGRENIEGIVPDRDEGGESGRLKGSDEILAFENSLPDYLHEAGVSDGVSGTAGDVKTQDDLAR
jgi:hypothetical protein